MLVLVANFLLAAAVGQAAPDAGWLKSVPVDADVVVHVRNIEGVRDDITAMLRAMSPALAQQVAPVIEQAVDQFTSRFSKHAARTEFLILARAVPPENPGQLPAAVLVRAPNHEEVLKAVAGEGVDRKDEGDGLVSFPGADGGTWYATPGEGFTAFGPDRALVAAVAKPGEKTLSDAIGDNATKLLGGDLGVYVNIAALTSRYEAQIDAARELFMALLDAAGQQAGNGNAMGVAKKLYGGMFDGVKIGESLVFHLDLDAAGLEVDGIATVKPDSKAARDLAEAPAPSGFETLGKLPAASGYFLHLDMNGEEITRMQNLGMSMMFPEGDVTPEMKAALKTLKDLGRMRIDSASGFGGGMESLSVTHTENPEAMVAATLANSQAMKTDRPEAMNFIKNVEIVEKAETHRGITFTRGTVTFDLDKLAKMSGPSGNRAMLEAMFGGDAIRTWYGIHEKSVLTVIAKDWDAAKARLDAYLDGKATLGETASYKAVAARLPKTASFVGLLSAQGLVQQLSTQFSAMLQNPNLKPPGDLPAEPALMGGAIQPVRDGFQFKAVVPSAVVPVLEKGLTPLLQGLQGVQGR